MEPQRVSETRVHKSCAMITNAGSPEGERGLMVGVQWVKEEKKYPMSDMTGWNHKFLSSKRTPAFRLHLVNIVLSSVNVFTVCQPLGHRPHCHLDEMFQDGMSEIWFLFKMHMQHSLILLEHLNLWLTFIHDSISGFYSFNPTDEWSVPKVVWILVVLNYKTDPWTALRGNPPNWGSLSLRKWFMGCRVMCCFWQMDGVIKRSVRITWWHTGWLHSSP